MRQTHTKGALPEPHDEPWPVPPNWSWSNVGNIVSPISNVDFKRSADDSDFVYIDLGAIKAGQIAAPSKIKTCNAPSRARQLVQAGDTLLSCVRVYLRNICIIPPSLDGAIASTAFCVLRPGPAVDPQYLNYFILDRRFTKWLEPLQRGNSPPAVLHKDVKLQPIPIPPLPEQRRIVARIDELFAEIANGEAVLQAAQEGLLTFHRSLLKTAFSGQLTCDWRKAKRSNDSGAELIAQAKEKKALAARGTRKSKTGELAIDQPIQDHTDVPQSWGVAHFGEIFNLFTGATPSRASPEYWSGNVPWVSSGEVAFCRIKHTNEYTTAAGLTASSTRLHPKGTILLAMIGEGKTRGQCAILDIEAANNQNAAAIRVSETPIPPEYVYEFLSYRYEKTRRDGQGGNQPALNLGKVARISMPVPPLTEIRIIMDILAESRAAMDDIAKLQGRAAADAVALRQSILKAAFEGRLVPQDASDEPAASLFSRLGADGSAASRAGRQRAA